LSSTLTHGTYAALDPGRANRRELHARHAGRTFSMEFEPPREGGMTLLRQSSTSSQPQNAQR
jgi:hypothetical protein